MTSRLKSTSAAISEGPMTPGPLLLICEHASCAFPPEFGDLGLDEDVRRSHVAWDPGALALTRYLGDALGAPLVAGNVSRLLYDCNRPPEAPDATPAKSEVFDIPGNVGLDAGARKERADSIYHPFSAAVESAIAQVDPAAIVTIHSFTPVYFGAPRAVEIGVLHDADTRLADALLAALPGAPPQVDRNQPYGPEHGVTHTLKRHALPGNRLNVMLEVRNDLIADDAGVARIGALLAPALKQALAETGQGAAQ